MIVVLDGALGSFAKGMVSLDMQFAAISGMGLHAHDPCCGPLRFATPASCLTHEIGGVKIAVPGGFDPADPGRVIAAIRSAS